MVNFEKNRDRFFNRQQAGQMLAEQLKTYANKPNVIVLALPRGGVPVAYEIAKTLSLPLDVFIVRKLGVPGHEELAMGALASEKTVFLNEGIIKSLTIPKSSIDSRIQLEERELERREMLYRGNRPLPQLQNKTILLIDDGIATGATMKVAIQALRKLKPESLVVAVPVAARSTCIELETLADVFICPLQPTIFYAVGSWYDDFSQTTDEEVTELLQLCSDTTPNHSS